MGQALPTRNLTGIYTLSLSFQTQSQLITEHLT